MTDAASMTPDRLRYDSSYEETVNLKDGGQALLRLVRPSDKEILQAGFASLSADSRFRRFLSSRGSLSMRDLSYLTELDQRDHFAIGALRMSSSSPPTGLGIARFIRLRDRPNVAEAAVAVVDEMQRKGLGRILLRRLAEAALERGIDRFYCEILSSNTPMHNLLRGLRVEPIETEDDSEAGVLCLEIPLIEPSAGAFGPMDLLPALPALLEKLLAWVAEGLIVVRRTVERAIPQDEPKDEPEDEPKDEEEIEKDYP